MNRLYFFAVAFLLVAANSSHGDDAGEEFFEKQVRPILVARCFPCHSGTKTSGGLSLGSRQGWTKGGESGPAIIAGKPEESLLIEAVNYRSLQMPPSDKGGKLPENEIAILTEWVKKGAPDPRDEHSKIGGMSLTDATKWWAFQPLPASAGPVATAAKIDSEINENLAAQSLTPMPAADKRTLIRRATYDLTGLPPTNEEVEAFLNDHSPDAFSKLVDRLLESPQYGVHWGRHWLDVVRYADTAGENTDRPLTHAWRYRNWVFDAYNRDMPFDEFVRLQIAGDLIRNTRPSDQRNEGIIATGYLAIARRFGHDIDKDLHLMHEDVIDNLGKNFLGLTIGCARCHDHKYDPINSKDYYALYGIFDSTKFSFPGCEAKGQPRDMVPLLSPLEIDSLMKPWRDQVAAREAEQKRRESLVSKPKLKTLASESARVLAKSQVGEGASVPIQKDYQSKIRVHMTPGETLQLTVSPNANYGADSTLVELAIEQIGDGAKSRWSVTDLIGEFTKSNPQSAAGEAIWCFLDVVEGPAFLNTKKEVIDGHSELKAWALGDTPSVFVNSAMQPIKVWTELPANSFFVHPGEQRPVAIAWVSSREGDFEITGRVADAHPAGLDGVSFVLEHIANPEYGKSLKTRGELQATPLPDPGPQPIIPLAYAVEEGSPHEARIHERGDPEKLGNVTPRGWLEILGGDLAPTEGGSGRQQLAEWIVRQPLMARVFANRIWQWHFGEGLVRSPNDFGSRGEKPTHPELLDALAAELVANGFRVKALHRSILNSATWKRSSASPSLLLERDPENKLLGRFHRRRLSAEEIRDSLLFVAGRLEMDAGTAHPFPPESTWTFTQHGPFNAVYDSKKRSAFQMVQRQRQHPFLALFDGADPNASTPKRQITTAPTQALFFLNDPTFHDLANQTAKRVLSHPAETDRINLLFQLLFQRPASKSEKERSEKVMSNMDGSLEVKWSGLARVLMSSNEFLYVD